MAIFAPMDRASAWAYAGVTPDTRHEALCQRMLDALHEHMTAMPDHPPHFVLAEPGVAIYASLLDIGPRLCRNTYAYAFILWSCGEGIRLTVSPPPYLLPTYLMLEAVVTFADLPVERVSLAELGLSAGSA